MDRVLLTKAAFDIGLSLTTDQLEAFDAFEDELYAANSMMNLTRVPRQECWLRHFLDCLLIQRLVPRGASVLDIGAGPGFPAWPLACARPDLNVTAMDSSGKMLGFLGRMPLPNLTLRLARAEEAGIREQFDFVTGRALAPLGIQLELSAQPCRVDGAVAPMRTPNDESAIRSFVGVGLGLQLESTERMHLAGTDIERVFPVFRKISRTARHLPRTWAEIRRAPLV